MTFRWDEEEVKFVENHSRLLEEASNGDKNAWNKLCEALLYDLIFFNRLAVAVVYLVEGSKAFRVEEDWFDKVARLTIDSERFGHLFGDTPLTSVAIEKGNSGAETKEKTKNKLVGKMTTGFIFRDCSREDLKKFLEEVNW